MSEVTDPNVSDAGIVGEDDTTTDASGADGMAREKEAGGPTDGGADGATQGLDPSLDLPGPGTTCATPGTFGDCPGLTVCRIATSTTGRCESCTTCGNLNASCNASSECDVLFQCYKGKCANICPLGTSFCGPVADCIDVGHATHGVCKP